MEPIKDSTQQLQAQSKEVSRRMAEFFANHGGTIGVSGGVLMSMAAAANLLAGTGLSAPELIEANQATSTAIFLGGLLKMGSMACAQAVARFHLKGVDGLLEGLGNLAESETQSVDPRASRHRGAEPVEDEVLSHPMFQKAMKDVFIGLQNDPETRAGIVKLLNNNPHARSALVKVQEEIEAANEVKNRQRDAVSASDLDGTQEPAGPSLH